MNRHWLVTGGAGFIGTHLVTALVDRGDTVTIFDINAPSTAVFGQVRSLQADIRKFADLYGAMAGVDGVFHLAANPDVQHCIENWTGGHVTNSSGTVNVFRAAQAHGSIPVVYASSAAVYGDRSGQVCHEGLPERPISPYGADKVSCEHQARAFWHIHGLPTAGLRLFNVYGPGQRAASAYAGVLARFIENSSHGRPNTIFGDGGQTRDFIHVDNVVGAFIGAMSRLRRSPEALISNVCTGRSLSLLDVSRIIDAHFGQTSNEPLFTPGKAGDIRHSWGCTAEMKRLCKLPSTIPIELGLARTIHAPQLRQHAL